MMNDGFKLNNDGITIFTVDESEYLTLVLPREVAAYFFRTEDRAEIYELISDAYNTRYFDDLNEDEDEDSDFR